jgi:hypothetical protein
VIDTIDSEGLPKFQEGWRRILNHGAPRSPVGGIATLIIDTLPFFLRDHLQDRYLEGLGWCFAQPSESCVSIGADDADTFVRVSKARIEERIGSLSRLLRRLLFGD